MQATALCFLQSNLCCLPGYYTHSSTGDFAAVSSHSGGDYHEYNIYATLRCLGQRKPIASYLTEEYATITSDKADHPYRLTGVVLSSGCNLQSGVAPLPK